MAAPDRRSSQDETAYGASGSEQLLRLVGDDNLLEAMHYTACGFDDVSDFGGERATESEEVLNISYICPTTSQPTCVSTFICRFVQFLRLRAHRSNYRQNGDKGHL